MSDLLSAMPTATFAWAAVAPPMVTAVASSERSRTVRIRRMERERYRAPRATTPCSTPSAGRVSPSGPMKPESQVGPPPTPVSQW
jgi:hypothetical protein